MKRRLSVVVTTMDNETTLPRLLASVPFADEVLVLDSGSRDQTCAIATGAGARVVVQPFMGYGPQKQRAIDLARNDWVLLLDADEFVSPELARRIMSEFPEAPAIKPEPRPEPRTPTRTPLTTDWTPTKDAWRIARRERMFWQWQHPGSRHNLHLRLFDRRCTTMSDDPIHAAPRCSGRIGDIHAPLMHWGEPDIHTKVEKINRYSSGISERQEKRAMPLIALRLLLYPPFTVLKQLLLKRHFLNGWAGWIHSVSMGYYSFLKDAKALEHRRKSAIRAGSPRTTSPRD